MLKPDATWGPATVVVVVLVSIVALAGAIAAIIGDNGFSFQDYVTTLVGAATATGLLGIGRGYLAGKRAESGTTTGTP
jgi:hypothetical protein